MIKIKAIVNYFDKKKNEQIPAGTEYEVSDERAKEIIKRGFAQLVEKASEEIHELKEKLQEKTQEPKEEVTEQKEKVEEAINDAK